MSGQTFSRPHPFSLRRFLRNSVREPLWAISVLWPLALLGPFLPGIPKPEPSGYPWRQEVLIAAFLTLTLALLARRAWTLASQRLSLSRAEFFLLLPAILYALWTASSAWWAAHPPSAIHAAFAWCAYLIFFILMRRVAERPRLLRASLFALGGVVWMLCLASMVSYWGAPLDSGVSNNSLFRFFSGFSEPMAVTVPLFAALSLRARSLRYVVLCGATAVLAWMATLQTVERAPVIGAGAGLLLLAAGMLVLKRCRPRSWRRALVLLGAFVLATTLQVVSSSALQGKTSAFARLQSTNSEEANTRVRLLFWRIGLEMFKAHPFRGVGANNYEIAYPEARASFSANYPNHPLVGLHEEMLVQHAHNEYVQILAELGLTGALLFAIFGAGLIVAFWRALKVSSSALTALGAGGGMLAFALSSGASAFSFRWMGSGLLFFFAAALVTRFAYPTAQRDERAFNFKWPVPLRTAPACALLLTLAMLYSAASHGLNVALHGAAMASASPAQAEQLYRAALAWNPTDPATHYNYGIQLFYERRASEAVPHLRYAVARGLNASVCYANLAAAEETAGDAPAAERTLAFAVNVYPRSVFLRTRHAFVLKALGQTAESEREYGVALSQDAKTARGWWQLMNYGVDAAGLAAREDASIAMPGALYPENCLLAELAAIEIRSPELAAKKKDFLQADPR